MLVSGSVLLTVVPRLLTWTQSTATTFHPENFSCVQQIGKKRPNGPAVFFVWVIGPEPTKRSQTHCRCNEQGLKKHPMIC